MKTMIVTLLSLILLFSCSLDNVWQKTGAAEKKPLALTASVYEGNKENGKLDMVSAILGDGHAISFSVDMPDEFTGKILRSLSSDELETLTATIKAKCYTDDEMRAFLSAPLSDETITAGMRGAAQLFDACSDKITLAITSCLPIFEIRDDASDEERSFGEFYNRVINEMTKWIEGQIDGFFAPVTSFLSSDTLTNGDYITCQLTVNLVDGLLESIEDVFASASAEISKPRSLDLTSSEGREKIKTTITKAGVSVAKDAVSSVCHNLLTPIACMDQITNVYGSEVKLPSISSLLSVLTGGAMK